MFAFSRRSHRTHHSNHGHVENDESWHPTTKARERPPHGLCAQPPQQHCPRCLPGSTGSMLSSRGVLLSLLSSPLQALFDNFSWWNRMGRLSLPLAMLVRLPSLTPRRARALVFLPSQRSRLRLRRLCRRQPCSIATV